ncbi:conserved hypothetical protein [Trichinella spiralis]|uniref:hypothetical protein n=1 Tax=Trichinella spiralis TaxID=6334 RepID=UPI0001EFC170|nr:conserved hypothetical protein [Trichinella spiralis]
MHHMKLIEQSRILSKGLHKKAVKNLPEVDRHIFSFFPSFTIATTPTLVVISLREKHEWDSSLRYCSRLCCQNFFMVKTTHFTSLQDEFLHYFHDVETQHLIYKLVRNPFLANDRRTCISHIIFKKDPWNRNSTSLCVRKFFGKITS